MEKLKNISSHIEENYNENEIKNENFNMIFLFLDVLFFAFPPLTLIYIFDLHLTNIISLISFLTFSLGTLIILVFGTLNILYSKFIIKTDLSFYFKARKNKKSFKKRLLKDYGINISTTIYNYNQILELGLPLTDENILNFDSITDDLTIKNKKESDINLVKSLNKTKVTDTPDILDKFNQVFKDRSITSLFIFLFIFTPLSFISSLFVFNNPFIAISIVSITMLSFLLFFKIFNIKDLYNIFFHFGLTGHFIYNDLKRLDLLSNKYIFKYKKFLDEEKNKFSINKISPFYHYLSVFTISLFIFSLFYIIDESSLIYISGNLGKIITLIGFLLTFILFTLSNTNNKTYVLFSGIIISIIIGSLIGVSSIFFDAGTCAMGAPGEYC